MYHTWIITEDHLAARNPRFFSAVGSYGPRPGTRRREAERVLRRKDAQPFRVVNNAGDVGYVGKVWPPCRDIETFGFWNANGDWGVDVTWGYTILEVLDEHGGWWALNN